MSVNNETTENFWQAYQSRVETQRVNPDHAPFYVRWAKAFEDFWSGLRHSINGGIRSVVSGNGFESIRITRQNP